MPWTAHWLAKRKGHYPVVKADWCRRAALPAAVEKEKGLFCFVAKAKAKCAQTHALSCSHGPGQHSLPLCKRKSLAQRWSEPWQGASLPFPAQLLMWRGRLRSASAPAPQQAKGLPLNHSCARAAPAQQESCSLVAFWLLASTTAYIWTQQ